MPSSHLILCCPLLLLPPIPPSIRVFSNESTLRMRWPKYWSFSFSNSPSKEHPGLISFRMDWLDLRCIEAFCWLCYTNNTFSNELMWWDQFLPLLQNQALPPQTTQWFDTTLLSFLAWPVFHQGSGWLSIFWMVCFHVFLLLILSFIYLNELDEHLLCSWNCFCFLG